MSTNKVTDSVSKRQKAETKQLIKLQQKAAQAQKEAEAAKLADSLANGITAYSVKDYRKNTLEALEKHIDTLKNDGIDGNELSDEQIKLAKDYIKSKAFKKQVKSNMSDYALEELSAITGDKEIIRANDEAITNKKGDVKKGKVKNVVQAELERQFKDGEITKEQYEFLKQKSKTSGSFWQFFGGNKNEKTDRLYEVATNTTNRDIKQESLTEGTEEAQEKAMDERFSAEMEARLKQRGFTPEKLYEIYEANGGAADGTINYSYKKIQPGEQHAILAQLNAGRKDGDYEFTMSDVRSIGNSLGYEVEKPVDGAIVTRDAVAGGIIGSPAVAKSTSSAVAIAGSTTATAASKSVVPFGAPIGAVIGAGVSVYKQVTRVEDRAIPDDVFKGVETYDDYVKNLEQFATKDGAQLGRLIGKYYNLPEGFQIEQLKRDLHHSAGTDRTDGTPLNYEEASGLLAKLSSGEKVIKAPEKPVVVTQEVVVVDTIKDGIANEEDVPYCPYTVERGHNPWQVAVAKYGATGRDALAVAREIKKLVKQTDPNADFWKVGVHVELPMTITVNGKTFNADCDAQVTAGSTTPGSYNGRSSSVGYDTGKTTVYSDRHRTNVYDVANDGVRTHKSELYNGGNRTVAVTEANNYKKEHETKTNKVSVEI